MNVFLTGNVQIGKSTAINRFIERSGYKPLGFRTKINRATGSLMMEVIGNNGIDAFEVASRGVEVNYPIPDISAFNCAGELMRAADTSNCELFLMDELGYMERNAEIFKSAVQEILDRGIKTVGVLRNRPDGPFWTMLHERSDTKIVTVTEENREEMPDIIANLLK